jgi:hypothetical protein
MTLHRFDHGVDHHGQVEAANGVPLQASNWTSYSGAEVALDPVEAYFECITTCSLDDGDCVTTCTEILRQQS